MAVTSLHPETRRWLTSLGRDATPGSEHTLSIGHPINGGEFTTFRLGGVIAHNRYGEPLFDLDEAQIGMGYFGDAGFYTREQLRDLAAAHYGLYFHFGARLQRPYHPDRTPPYPSYLMKACAA